jgi:cholest-4-en-3-one 26-monooxygenase
MPQAIEFADIDLTDSKQFVEAVPHDVFTFLRKNAPVWWQEEKDGPGFWAVTRYEDCNTVNRDYEHFSSHSNATFIWELDEAALAQQQLVMLNMDPPLHTRYRRLVNKGFTPRMVAQLHDRIHAATDAIIDKVIEKGEADFVTDLSAELPLVVIAELLGVPNEDRHRMFNWSNRMVGNEDPEYQAAEDDALAASMELYAYAAELFARKRIDPNEDLMSVLNDVEIEGERLSDFELELFFLLLTVAGNETTRNLISGAMAAFFEFPDQWDLLVHDRSLLPSAVEEMLRFVSPVMNFRRQTTGPVVLGGQKIEEDLREPPGLRHHPQPQSSHRLRRRRSPLLPGGQPRPHGDPGHVRAPPRPGPRHPCHRQGGAPPVPVHQRRQAHPCGLHARCPGRRLMWSDGPTTH